MRSRVAYGAKGWRSISPPTAPTRLLKARVIRYDVLVLDRDLPGLHGDEVCRAVRGERPDTGILMLTAAGAIEDLVEGLSLGADDYLAEAVSLRRAGGADPRARAALRSAPARRAESRATSSLTRPAGA